MTSSDLFFIALVLVTLAVIGALVLILRLIGRVERLEARLEAS